MYTTPYTVLLTGGAGFVGSHTYLALVGAGYNAIILDDFSNARRDTLDRLQGLTGKPVHCVEGSVLNRRVLDRVFSENRIDAVIHLAARKHVGESTSRPLDYFETNVSGLVNVMQAMSAAGVFRLVFSSSCTVYGAPKMLPVSEDASRVFTSPYGHTKLICEQLLEHASASDPRWQIGLLRYFNPVGCHPSGWIGENALSPSENLMPILARVAAGELPFVQIFGDDYPTADGTAVRDYVHVCDVAEGHVLFLDRLPEEGRTLAVNLGTGQGHSVLDLVKAYSRTTGRAVPYRFAARRAGDIASTYADVSRARRLMGFEAKFSIDDMCESSWRWTQNMLMAT